MTVIQMKDSEFIASSFPGLRPDFFFQSTPVLFLQEAREILVPRLQTAKKLQI